MHSSAMGNPAKDAAPGTGANVEDPADPAAAPSQRSRKVPTLHRTLEQNTRFVLEKHLNNGVQNKFVMCDSWPQCQVRHLA